MVSRIFLFDVDGTLTRPRQPVDSTMLTFLSSLCATEKVAFVGGSDLAKIQEQLHTDTLALAEYTFAENGCVVLRKGGLVHEESIVQALGEETVQRLINFALRYIAEVEIPTKRGTFVEYRTGMINLSPVGRNCSQTERDEFARLDEQLGVRKAFVAALAEEFKNTQLQFSIGGQISIDAFPRGWDKTHCLSWLSEFQEIHFFGDRTAPGGNDYEIFCSERTIGHSVTSPEATIQQVTGILNNQ